MAEKVYIDYGIYSKYERKKGGKPDNSNGAGLLIVNSDRLLTPEPVRCLIIRKYNGALCLPGGRLHKFNGELEKAIEGAVVNTSNIFRGFLPNGRLKNFPFVAEDYDGHGMTYRTFVLEISEEERKSWWPSKGIADPYELWQWSSIGDICQGRYMGVVKGLVKMLNETNLWI